MAVIPAGVIVHTNCSVPPRPGDGGNPKPRFVLLLDDLRDDGEPVIGLPITTLVRQDLAHISFGMPFNPKSKNCLTEYSVVICDWEFEVRWSDVRSRGTAIKNALLEQIVEKYVSLTAAD